MEITESMQMADALSNLLAAGLHKRLCPADVRVLEACWEWKYVDDVKELTLHRFGWLLHRRLLATAPDPSDDVRVETTDLGKSLVNWMRRQRSKAA